MEKNQLKTISSILLAFAMIIVSLTPTFAIEANDVTESPSKGLTVTATSNLFPEKKVTLCPNQKTIKVTYVLQTQSKDMLDFQWSMNYDSSVLKPTENSNKTTSFEYSDISAGSYSYNKSNQDEILGMGTNLKLYDTSSKEIVFVSAEFNIIDSSAIETNIDLNVQVLRVSNIDSTTDITASEEEAEIINSNINQENYDKYVKVCKTVTVPESLEEPTKIATIDSPTKEVTEPITEEPAEVPTTEPTTVPSTKPTTSEVTDTKIYFDVSTAPAEWGTTKKVYCHLYAVAGDELPETSWQTPAEVCKKDEKTGLYYFDTASITNEDGTPHGGLKDNADYAVIFSTKDTKKATHQTCNITLGKPCLGDTVYLTGGKVENTEDSLKLDYVATWRNNSDNYGPKAAITSCGKVIDGCYPIYLSRAEMVAQALYNWAVKRPNHYTPETVANICAEVEAEPIDVYNTYAEVYATQLADPEAYPDCAPLSTIATLLGVDPSVTEEPTTTEPATEEPTEAPTTEPATEEPTEAPTTEPATEEPTEAPTTEPATEEPTEAPTTEPATEEPTEAPTTEPVTTEPVTEPTTEPAPAADPIYVVAGSEEFAGLKWIGDPVGGAQNVMTKDGDLYTKTFTAAPAGKSYQIKVVKNVEGTDPETGDKVWNQTWFGIGEEYKDNLTFNVTDTCDVTVTFNPATNEINVTGDNVKVFTGFEVEYITAVGNGFEGWLNGENWTIDADSNKLEMVSDKVYKITYKDVTSSDCYVFKFAANGSWVDNWGLPAEENGAPVGENYALTYNGENMVLDTVALGYEEGTLLDVTLTLDLTNFDYSSKQGAIARIEVTEQHTHTFKLIKEQKVTCTEDGYKLYKCSCGLTKIGSIIKASGHNYDAWKITTMPTCYKSGIITKVCANCGDRISEELQPFEHTYKKISTIPPTCVEKGYSIYKCIFCDIEKKDDYVDYSGHNYEVVSVVKPTCTEKGYTLYRCAVCGNEKKGNYVDTLPHNYEIINQNEATCTAEGFIVKRCSVCQKLDFVTIPKIVHRNFVNSISCDKCGATLESSHNGTDDSNSTWILKYDNAKSITITFSEDSKIAQGTDYIYILDYNYQVVAELTGSEFAGKSYTFKSDILYISKATSQPFTGYGFKVVSAVANYGVIGDINLDNSIDVKDSTLIQKFSAMLIELDKTELALADANGDGRVDVKDVTIIQKYCVNLTVDSKIGSKLST